MLRKDINYLNQVMHFRKMHLYNNYFCWLYPFTNENINAYYKYLDFENKKVLTVTSSGDHALNALLKGAKEVDSFDANPLAKYYSELKCAAIKTLSYEEFIIFFNNIKTIIGYSKYYFDSKTYYKKIREELSDDFKKFWDYFFETFSKKKIIKSYLFSEDVLSLGAIMEVNSYLRENNYYKLQKILKNKKITYHDINISTLNQLDKEYDIVIFSNIAAYLDDIYRSDCLKYFKDIINQLNRNKSTRFVICYLFADCLKSSDVELDDIYNPVYVRKYFSDKEYEYIEFNSPEIYEDTHFFKVMKKDKVIISKEKKFD